MDYLHVQADKPWNNYYIIPDDNHLTEKIVHGYHCSRAIRVELLLQNVYLRNECNFWKVHGIMNTSGL